MPSLSAPCVTGSTSPTGEGRPTDVHRLALVAKKPKSKCCVSKPRCTRCPLRMLADGTLPDGYTVKNRRLVAIDGWSDGASRSGATAKKNKKSRKAKKGKKTNRGKKTKLTHAS